MTPEEFIKKWRDSERKESAASHQHFLDLCDLLEVDKLVNAHSALDEAVAAAYGWPADLSDDEILARLLDLNLARAAKQDAAKPAKKTARQCS